MNTGPREIRLFVAAFEERSFTAAAARENATQSGVSQHIKKLEERSGVRLFARTGGMVVPTPAGEEYYRHCLEVLRAHDSAERALRQFGKGLDGEVAIGLMPTMTRCALAPALARFLEMHPNVVVRVVEAYSAALTQMVRGDELSFAIVPAFATGPGLKSRRVLHTPEVLVAAARAGREHMAPLRLATLGPLKLVLPGGQNTRGQTLQTYFAANGVAVARLLELDAMLGTLDLVATSDWATVLPGVMMARDVVSGRFCINPLTEPALGLDLVQIESSRRAMSPAAHAFAQVLEEETARINQVWTPAPARKSRARG